MKKAAVRMVGGGVRRGRLLAFALTVLWLAGVEGAAPYFSRDTPPDGAVFFYTPGTNYAFPPEGYTIGIWDDDDDNTVEGYIPIKKDVFCETTNGQKGPAGCWDGQDVRFSTNNKFLEDPVHIEVGAYIGSKDWDPHTSRWWLPRRDAVEGTADVGVDPYLNDPLENMKQHYRCSEYNPTLPGLNFHRIDDPKYAGQGDNLKLEYPNTHAEAKNCWENLLPQTGGLASSKLNVSYTHVPGWRNRTRLSITWKEDQALLDMNIPNPQRIICLTWKGMAGYKDYLTDQSVEKSRCWSVVFNVRPKLSLCSNTDDRIKPNTNKCGKFSLFNKEEGSVIPVGVQQKQESYIYFEDSNSDLTTNCSVCDSVKIYVTSRVGSGLPNKAILYETKGPRDIDMSSDAPSRQVPIMFDGAQTSASYYQYSRKLVYTPEEDSATQVSVQGTDASRNGLKYMTCFFAVSTTTTFYPPKKVELKSRDYCVFIQVVRPEPELISGALPQLQLGMSGEDGEDLQLERFDNTDREDVQAVNIQNLPIKFKANVNCPYKWKVELYDQKDKLSNFRIQTATIAGYQPGLYKAIARPDPKNPLPPGAVLSPYNQNMEYQILSWSPVRGLEAKTFRFCLLISELHIKEGSHRQCTNIYVQKCTVCGKPSDTLLSISMEYKTDWLQLWGANYNVSNPNNLKNYIRLKLGPMYVVTKDEDTKILASRFSMTTEALMAINPDLLGNTSLVAGTQVCLMPRICDNI